MRVQNCYCTAILTLFLGPYVGVVCRDLKLEPLFVKDFNNKKFECESFQELCLEVYYC